MSNTKEAIAITRIDFTKKATQRIEDLIAKESPLHILINGVHFVSLLCTPLLLRELVVGHLLSEGVVDSPDSITSMVFDDQNRCTVTLKVEDSTERIYVQPFARLVISSCGGLGYKSLSEVLDRVNFKPLPRWRLEVRLLMECLRKLSVSAVDFRQTGGVHVAALFDRSGKLVELAEDVGRHNAIDKVIGSSSLKQQDLSNSFLASSGRLTGNIVLKAARTGIPIVASLAAAIDSGVTVAEKAGITLIGFARGTRMNVYTYPKRLDI